MSQIRQITQDEIGSCIALKKIAYPGLEIDPAVFAAHFFYPFPND
jgi:hypothetical protein